MTSPADPVEPTQPQSVEPQSVEPRPVQPLPVQPQPLPPPPFPPTYTAPAVRVYPANDLAVWSLVLGVAGLVLGCLFVTGIPAVILGNKSTKAAAAGQADNPELATVGVVLGWVSIGIGVVLVGVLLLVGLGGLVIAAVVAVAS